ncbi:MAG: glycosyltransferase family 1 protein [Betaproteobacteria bacterium]|nr:glycosyltransferase family 1 protein [Betaproteobacteria bacterium]
MRIVHTESSLGWGGQEIRILSESQGLIARGHNVTLLCPPQARIHAEAQRRGVPVIALPIGRKRFGGLRALIDWFRANRCDVVNTHSSTDAWLVALALLVLGRPFPMVRTRHISAAVPTNCTTNWLYERATRRILTTGESIRQQLVDRNGYTPGRIESVPTGIDATRFSPGDRDVARGALGLPADRTLVGIVATLRSWKGHRYLIDAVAGLPASIGLMIVGDGPQREALAKQSQVLKGRLWMPGNQDDVLPWLHALDIFCLPSYANEGVPQALVQAMMTGLACVTTAAGSIGELAEHEKTALVVPIEDVSSLRAAIARLAGDAGLRERLGKAAREHVKDRYSYPTMLDRMEKVYRNVAGRA